MSGSNRDKSDRKSRARSHARAARLRAFWDGWRPDVLPALSPTQISAIRTDRGVTMNSKSPEYLTVKQVSLVLNCSERHVRRLISGASLPGGGSVRTASAGLVRIRLSDLKEFWNDGRPDNFCHTVSC